jgi:hypothetical protein
MCLTPSGQRKRPQLGGELGRWGLLCPEAPSTTGDLSTIPVHPGAGFWINPFGLDNRGGFVVAYFGIRRDDDPDDER